MELTRPLLKQALNQIKKEEADEGVLTVKKMHDMKLDLLTNLRNMVRGKRLDARLPSLNASYGIPKVDTGYCLLDNFRLVNPQ